VAKKLGAGEEREIPSLAWTSLLLMLLLGLAGTACILLISPWLVRSGLNVPDELEPEMLQSVPVAGAFDSFRESTHRRLARALEAHQRFGLISTHCGIPMGVFTFAGPLLVLPFSKSLVPVVGVLVAGRIARVGRAPASLSAGFYQNCAGSLLGSGLPWPAAALRRLDDSDNVVSPLLVTFDRFLIGALVFGDRSGLFTRPRLRSLPNSRSSPSR